MKEATAQEVKIIEATARKKEKYGSKPRIYIFLSGETIWENLDARWDRPYREYRKLLPEIYGLFNIPADAKASWSQKAGCSCGCSPGFILDGYYYSENDMFVTIKVD